MSARWSGYASQSEPWRRGYDWAQGHGPQAELDCFDAPGAFGYAFDSWQDRDFASGADFAQNEAQNERMGR